MEVGEWAEYSVGAARGGSEGRQRGEAVRGGSRGGSEGRQWGQASRTYCCGEERWDIVATVALVGLGVTRALGPGNVRGAALEGGISVPVAACALVRSAMARCSGVSPRALVAVTSMCSCSSSSRTCSRGHATQV